MSRDIRYIGMDVHKEAVVIAVLNSSGKLVMESIVETKANLLLEQLVATGMLRVILRNSGACTSRIPSKADSISRPCSRSSY
jgi:hypothetical protein